MTHYWKVLKADYSPPLQGGPPICDGKAWPVVLPTTRLDTSMDDCGAGWNCTREPDTAIRIAGMWGRLLVVEPSEDVIERGDKCRSSRMTLLREATEHEWYEAIKAFSWPFMDVPAMVTEQVQWLNAIHSQVVDKQAVEQGLRDALKSRGLDWSVKRYWNAWNAWNARDAWDAWNAWNVWNVRNARNAWNAWNAWNVWDARNARCVRNARNALTVYYTASMGWTAQDPMLLTTGLRDAYTNGLDIAIPTGPNELGYVMQRNAT